MATISIARIPAEVYLEVLKNDRNLKSWVDGRSVELASSVTARRLSRFLDVLRQYQVKYGGFVTEFGSVPAIVPYVRAQRDDLGYNVTGEYLTLIGLIDTAEALLDVGFAGIPDYDLDQSFTPAQTAPFKAVIDAISAAIQ